jgi:hypothetical protein
MIIHNKIFESFGTHAKPINESNQSIVTIKSTKDIDVHNALALLTKHGIKAQTGSRSQADIILEPKDVPKAKELLTKFKLLEAKEPYIVYHNSYSSAVQSAQKYAESKGYTVDEDDWWNRIAMGNKKPSAGKTNRATISLYKGDKLQRKALQIQVYGREGGKYELNCYIN